MKKTALIIAGLLLALARPAQANFSQTFGGGVIPDNDVSGWSATVNVPNSFTIDKVTVGLSLSGGWNGDLYATLVHSSGFAVLLNRVGRGDTGGLTSAGFQGPGMNVTLDDSAVLGRQNIHDVASLSPGGTY